MSESMIERVAKAITAVNENTVGFTYRQLTKEMARAAIEAMREPTDEMLVEMEEAAPAYTSFAAREDSPSFKAYQAAISAALKD